MLFFALLLMMYNSCNEGELVVLENRLKLMIGFFHPQDAEGCFARPEFPASHPDQYRIPEFSQRGGHPPRLQAALQPAQAAQQSQVGAAVFL